MTPQEIFEKAYDILVEHAGAPTADHYKPTFVDYYTSHRTHYEWRFMGKLGFGGKFWRYDGNYYITCYPEDRTAKMDRVIEKVNALLAELPYYEPPPSDYVPLLWGKGR